jgi:hypothetical protein
MLVHQMRASQQTQVLGNRRPRDRKRLGYLSGRLAAFAQQVEYGPAGRIGQGAESGFRGIRNRLVPHNA